MKILFILIIVSALQQTAFAQQVPQRPCATDTFYQQFDFWLGEWEVFGPNGKAGDSKIERILDSCVILENWTSARMGYAGKSFNTYNASTGQWQQTWVDNAGGSTEFLRGKAGKDIMTFYADKVADGKGGYFIRRLNFYKLGTDKVRQHGERSLDGGQTWVTEYDLEYRRKKSG